MMELELQLVNENQLELGVSNSGSTFQDLLESQENLLRSQIEELENIVLNQCNLTGVNPLSQEMAAGALSIQIGKRPRDLLNPKAIKYMQLVFSVKDAISKKEIREISALFGVTAMQVREFFATQRTRVKKFVRLSQEKANRSSSCEEMHEVIPLNSICNDPMNPVPLNSVVPTSMEQESSGLNQDAEDQSDKHFIEKIFSLMRKEESFSGQDRLLEWIMQMQNASVLYWFLTNGGVMILATWLTQALLEEQTSVLRVILKVFCHLPLQKALPVHMSAVLQSVNSLRFYRISDVSNRARFLLKKWSKTFARSQALRKGNGVKTAIDGEDEILLKQSINEVMDTESWHANIGNLEDGSAPMDESPGISKRLESQPVKLLTVSADDPNKKLGLGSLSSQTREKRKVLMVEQPGQKSIGRTSQNARSTTTRGRPLSADDIQKAKMRAQFIQSKYGRAKTTSDTIPQVQAEHANKTASSLTSILLSTSKTHEENVFEEPKKCDDLLSEATDPQIASVESKAADLQSDSIQNKSPDMQSASEENKASDPQSTSMEKKIVDLLMASVKNKITPHSDEPPWKKCKRIQIPWWVPPEFLLDASWGVCAGENSKEVEVQKNRIHRERETIYRTLQEIPTDPKEPWDSEMDYDDSLTPEIPVDQPPEVEVSPGGSDQALSKPGGASSESAAGMPEPDLELLAALLKNPQLVLALTSGQAGNMSNEATVKLLDMIKLNETKTFASSSSGKEAVEVSLPSPTPSTDAVTSSWKPDYVKNPFSQQKTIVSQEVRSMLRALPENFLASSMVQSHDSPARSVVADQSTVFRQMEQLPVAPAFIPEERLRASSLVQPQMTQQMLPQAYGTSSYHHHTTRNAVNPALYDASYPTTAGHRPRPQPQPQPQPQHQTSSYRSTPEPVTTSWWPRQGGNTMRHYQSDVNPSEYNSYRATVQQPGSWENGKSMGDPTFESWSPDNSPRRSHTYNVPGWSVQEPRMYQGRGCLPERSLPRQSGYQSSSGYQDPGMNDPKRWRNRR